MGAFEGQLLQSPKGDSCRGEGANTGSRAVLSALCPGGWQWRLSFLENRKKSRKPFKDFLLGGAAGGRLVFSFEISDQVGSMKEQTDNLLIIFSS